MKRPVLESLVRPAEHIHHFTSCVTRSKPYSLWLLAAIALLLVQTLPFFTFRWVTDESWYTGPGYSVAHGHGVADPAIGPNDIENHFDARPPGTALVIASMFRLFGVGQAQARAGSALAAVLVLLLTYVLARDVLGGVGALITVTVLATDNFLVASARTARPEALTTMAVMLSLWAMSRYARRADLLWAFASGLLMAAGAMFHITVLGFVLSFGLLSIVLDVRSKRFALRGAATYSAGFLLGLVPFAAWILTNPLGKQGFRAEYLARVHETLTMKLVHEGKRYGDMLGMRQLHGHGLEWLPVRVLIPLCFVAACVLLYRFRPRWLFLELLLILPTVVWFVETANKSSRYFALAAPFFALAIGACAAAVWSDRAWRKPVLAGVVLLISMQFGSNLLLLRAASRADYTRVGKELQSAIPRGEPVYGTITFWLAMHDHPYVSYERTIPSMAEQQYGVRYFVLGDRMMTQGEPWDAAFYSDMNGYLDRLKTRSTLVAEFPDPYYGDLKVYRSR